MDRPKLTADETALLCRAINTFGSGEHAFAEPENFHLFEMPYVKRCLFLIPNEELTMDGLMLKMEITVKLWQVIPMEKTWVIE